jgi:hypothetical protein
VGDPTDCDDSDPNSGFCIFEEVNFTTCGATGASGPSSGDCNTAYGGTTLDGYVSVSSGIQTWIVPDNGDYVILAVGADGGDNTDHGYIGGYGASMGGTFALTAGQVLEIVVGQSGTNGSDDAGGGGGSFVAVQGASLPLIAAGGGGGGAENDDNAGSMTLYKNGVITECGQGAPQHSGGGTTNPGGCNGNGGSNDPHHYGQGAGAGFLTDGDNGSGGNLCNGKAFVNGAEGCNNGGFGGGGNGGGDGGGGAGGYSGGAGGSGGGSPDGPGGGGGSYNTGTNQLNSDGANNAGGYVTISAA